MADEGHVLRLSTNGVTSGAQPDGRPHVLSIRPGCLQILATLAEHRCFAVGIFDSEQDGEGNSLGREARLRTNETGNLEAPLR